MYGKDIDLIASEERRQGPIKNGKTIKMAKYSQQHAKNCHN